MGTLTTGRYLLLFSLLFYSIISFGQAPPVLDAIGNKTSYGGSVIFFLAAATDADGDELHFSLSGSGLQSGMQIDSVNGLFVWIPEVSEIGSHSLTVTVSDGSLEDTETITITVDEALANNKVRYVDVNASGSNDGSSWANAHNDLKAAIAASSEGEQLWVADGIYTPAPPDGNRNSAFILPANVAIYGGFDGGEANLALRNFDTYRTILSGDLNADDNTVGNNENSSQVLGFTNEGALVDGITVTAANDGSVIRSFSKDTWVIFRNSRVEDNNYVNHGVSPHITVGSSSGPTAFTFINTLFTNNRGSGQLLTVSGPFVSQKKTHVNFYNCSFVSNDDILNSQRSSVKVRFTNSLFDRNGDNYTFSLSGASFEFVNCIFPDDPNDHSTTNITLFTNNLVNQDIDLTPLHSLAEGNLAIDAGDNDFVDATTFGPIDNDLFGDTRIVGGTVDLGAFEYVPNPGNTAPTLVNPIADQPATEDALFTFTFASDVFNDADGDQLFYGAELTDGSKLPAWLNFDSGTRTFSGTAPTNADAITYNIKVVASDKISNVSDEFTLTVTAVNDNPVLTAIGNKSFNTGREHHFTVSATDEESSSANISYSLDAGSVAKGMVINSSTGEFAWTPSGGQIGDHSVSITASDDADPAGTDSEIITISVVANSAPLLDPIGDFAVVEGSMVYFRAMSTDADGDNISYSISSALPGMIMTQSNGIFMWVPKESQTGTHQITVSASDGQVEGSLTVNITVNASANSGKVLFVDKDATGSETGVDWANAYTDLSTALADANNGDQLWVAAGSYKPSSSGDRDASFVANKDVTIYGGFNGTESSLADRNWVQNKTILTGDLNGDDNSAGIDDNSYIVVEVVLSNTAVLLDGMVIADSHANGGGVNNDGGAVHCRTSPGGLLIRNMLFENNTTDGNGVTGSIKFGQTTNPSTLIYYNTIARNNTTSGKFFNISGPTTGEGQTRYEIYNSTFVGNSAILNSQQRGSSGIIVNSLMDNTGSSQFFVTRGSIGFINSAFTFDPNDNHATISTFENNLVDQTITLGPDQELPVNSPFISKGNTDYVDGTLFGSIDNDFFGNPRINDAVDLGAAEYVNYRPVLTTSNDLTLDTIEEDESDNSGTQISSLVTAFGGIISDRNFDSAKGVAIVQVDNSNGSLEYSTNDGSSWATLGTVADDNALLLTTASTNRIRFVPQENFNGSVSSVLGFRAWDTLEGTNGTKADASVGGEFGAYSTATEVASITVTPANDAPTVSVDDQVINAGNTLSLVITGSDIEGDALSYALDGASSGKGMTVDSSSGAFSWNPDGSHVGDHDVTVTVSDSELNGSAVFKIVVNAAGTPFVDKGIADQSVNEDTNFTMDIPADAFSDNGGVSNLIFTARKSDGSALGGSFWLDFDGQTFSGTPLNADAGDFSVEVTATDGDNKSASTSFHISVIAVNDKPVVANAIGDQRIGVGDSFDLDVSSVFEDEEDASLKIVATLADDSGLPLWLAFDEADKSFSGQPGEGDIGTLTIKLIATDSQGGQVSTSFTLTVNPVTAINGEILHGISVYPNPARDWLVIKLTRVEGEQITIRLVDFAGKTTLTRRMALTDSNLRVEFDLSGIPNGVYLLEARTKSQVAQSRVIKN